MVSGSVSLSCSEYFSPFPHGTGSLSVSQEYLALPDGAGGFTQDFSGPVLLRIRLREYWDFIYRPVTFSGGVFQTPSTIEVFSVSAVLQPWPGLNLSSLGSSPFARHYLGNHVCFLFHRLLRCFSWPGSLPDYSGYHIFNMVGCPIGRSSDCRLFAPTRSLSQLVTSFIASESQGIRHALLLTFLSTVRQMHIINTKMSKNLSLNPGRSREWWRISESNR